MIAIIGGGIAGLSAAFELHRRGADFLLLEASPRLGGILRTDYNDELVIDAGPDAMLARKPAGIDLCEELGIAGRLIAAKHPRAAFVVRGGQLTELSTPSLSNAAFPAGDISLAAFFERFGRDAVDYYAEPVLAGIHAGDVDRLSMRALFPELLGDSPVPGAPDPQGAFRSFPRGMQELVDALASALPGDRVRVNARVMRLSATDAARWIIATPAFAAAKIFDSLDAELAALCRRIRYVSSGIVVLAYPHHSVRHPLAGSGFVVPRVERDMRVLAGTWLSSKWSGRAPEGVALIRTFFGGARDPGALELADEDLIAMAHADLARLLGITAAPSFWRVYRWIDGTPQYDVGYLNTLAAIRARASAHHIQLIGAGFGSIGIPDCIAAGRAAARAALG
jgi:oxygen-dependent protoporphyrinogen oxidase